MENKISAEEIIEEIFPLIGDCFVANCRIVGNALIMDFPDGQSAEIIVNMR